MKDLRPKEKAAPPPAHPVSLAAAVAWLKGQPPRRFDETVELHLRLNIRPGQSDQVVRGHVTLPAGAPTKPTVVVLTSSASAQQAALKAGASQAGGEELIAKIKAAGELKADVVVASPDLMPKIAAIARLLGPRGLMPNPKTGTISADPSKVVAERVGGTVSFKMDPLGNVHAGVAKLSWDTERIVANSAAFIAAVRAAKPDSVKGEVIKRITLKATMSPPLPLAP